MYFDKDHYWGWLLKIELQLVFKRTGSLKGTLKSGTTKMDPSDYL